MSLFKFKHFNLLQSNQLQKVGTDTMVLGALIKGDSVENILDIGTGTGVLALMMAQEFPTASVTAIDIDKTATDLAEINFENSPFKERLSAVLSDFLIFNSPLKYDLIVSNPPYFNTTMFSKDVQRTRARHEQSMPLEELLFKAADMLTENGSLWLILPQERTASLLANQKSKLCLKERIQIFGKPDKHVRDVLVFGFEIFEKPLISSFTIRDSAGNYSEEYKNLTRDFHYQRL